MVALFRKISLRALLCLLIVVGVAACGFVDSGGEGINDPPVVATGDDQVVNEQSSVTLTSSVVDDFNSIETYKWEQLSGSPVTLTGADTATASFIAPVVRVPESPLMLVFQLEVTDNFGSVGSGTVNVNVLAVNVPPIANDDTVSTFEDSPITINVISNDNDDADGAINPAGIEIVSSPINGAVKPNSDGTVTYTPKLNFFGADTFQYTVADNETVPSNVATTSISITPVNDPPVANQGSLTTLEGSSASGLLSATDPDSTLVFSIARNANKGTVTITSSSTGDYTYSPRGDLNGEDSFTFRVTDGEFDSTAEIAITITPVNDAPRFTTDPVTSATVGEPYIYNIVVTDPDEDDKLTITAPTLPGWLTLKATGNGMARLNGTPGAQDLGGHKVELQVTDNGVPAKRATQSFNVNVIPKNDPPTFTSTPVRSATVGVLYTYNVVASDPDAGDVLTITAPTKPGWLTLTPTGNGRARLSGTPAAGDVGSANVQLRVVDDGTPQKSAAQSFTITVASVNNPPGFTSSPVTSAQVGVPYTYNIVATDPDPGDMLTITAPTKPGWLSLTATGAGTAQLSGIPTTANVGPNGVSLQVADNGSPVRSAAQTFTIQVADDNDNDEDAKTSEISSENSAHCWTTVRDEPLVSNLADDRFSSLATYSVINNGTKGWVTILDSTTGQFEYVPDRQVAHGIDSFTYRVEDPGEAVEVRSAKVIFIPRIMLVGDSITAGISDGANNLPPLARRVGYRKQLYDSLMAGGYDFDFVGSQNTGFGITDLDPHNEGHSRWSADEIAYGRRLDGSQGIFKWLEKNPADIVLLHIGSEQLNTNTVGVEAIFNEIDRWEVSENGHPVIVIVARIINQTPFNPDVLSFNVNLEALVRARTNDPDNDAYPDEIIIVDQHSALDYPENLFDEIHPNKIGYDKMSKVWFDALANPQAGLLFKCP